MHTSACRHIAYCISAHTSLGCILGNGMVKFIKYVDLILDNDKPFLKYSSSLNTTGLNYADPLRCFF